MKKLLCLFCLNFPLLSVASPILHTHGGRVHSHELPAKGVFHRHGGGAMGTFISSISSTTGNKSPIINHPQTVIFNYSNGKSQNRRDSEELKQNKKKKNFGNVMYFEGVKITLKSCIQISDSVRCKFVLENTDANEIGVSLNANSLIIDTEGDTYYAYNSLIKFGNLNTSFPYKILLESIPVKAEMRFRKVTSKGSKIPLLKFGINSKKHSRYIQFRNINLM